MAHVPMGTGPIWIAIDTRICDTKPMDRSIGIHKEAMIVDIPLLGRRVRLRLAVSGWLQNMPERPFHPGNRRMIGGVPLPGVGKFRRARQSNAKSEGRNKLREITTLHQWLTPREKGRIVPHFDLFRSGLATTVDAVSVVMIP
jgi:hypothetical protein